MNTSSKEVFAVIIGVVVVIGLMLYFMFGTSTTTSVTVAPIATTTQTVPSTVTPSPVASSTATTTANTTPFTLSTAQKQALLKYGISSTSVPTTITVNQEACFDTALGSLRFAQITAGAVPTVLEFEKVKSCF